MWNLDDFSTMPLEDDLEPSPEELAAWPNCCVPDCEYKANVRGGSVPSDGSGRCVPHQLGFTPPVNYFGAIGDEDDLQD